MKFGLLILIFVLVSGFASVNSCEAEQGKQFTSLAFAPDSENVLAVSESGLQVLSWPQLSQVQSIELNTSRPFHLAFSPGGSQVLICGGAPAESGEAEIIRWPINEAEGQALVTKHEDVVMQGCWTSENSVALASLDKCLSLQSFAGPESGPETVLRGHSRSVTCVRALNGMLVSGSVDGSLRVWDINSGKQLRTLAIHTRPVLDLAVISDGIDSPSTIASVSEDRTIRIWQPKIGRMVRFIRLPRAAKCLSYSAEFKCLVAAAEDGFLYLCDPSTTEIIGKTRVANEAPFAMELHPNGTQCVLALATGGLKKVDLSTEVEITSR